jgi:hypothetical protein
LVLVGFHQRLENGANGAWPFGRPDVGSIYWIAATILLAVMLLITAWSYVRLLGLHSWDGGVVSRSPRWP